jgi:hypothetical protein
MATIARAETLAATLSDNAGGFGPQVWLDDIHGLVAGVFPFAKAKFDFGKEAAVSLVDTEQQTDRGPTGAAQKPRVVLLQHAKRVGQMYEIETRDAIFVVGSATQMLIQGLNLIEGEHPGTLERLALRKKQSKRPVAKDRADLYDVPHPEAHSAQLKNGWFVATNNKAPESRGVLRAAAEIAGLTWGSDFVVRKVG